MVVVKYSCPIRTLCLFKQTFLFFAICVQLTSSSSDDIPKESQPLEIRGNPRWSSRYNRKAKETYGNVTGTKHSDITTILDTPFSTEDELWDIIIETYNEMCGTQCGGRNLNSYTPGVCARCWCDMACIIYGDCCPDLYKRNGYTTLQDSNVQNCRKVTFPGTQGRDTYQMIGSCIDRDRKSALENYAREQNLSKYNLPTDTKGLGITNSDTPSMSANEVMPLEERMCVTPDLASHWNQSRPITDRVTGLTFVNQYCALCSQIDPQNSLPWKISIKASYSTFFSKPRSALETYRFAMTSKNAKVVYKPPLMDSKTVNTVRKCDDAEGQISECNITGLWRHYSEAAERACLMLNLPILPYPPDYMYHLVRYKNPYCYFCNHDVTWEQVKRLTRADPRTFIPASIVVDNIAGRVQNTLSILLDLDGSDDRVEGDDLEPESRDLQRCNASHFFDQAKDQCRDVMCAPDKFPSENQTCRSSSDIRSNAFGYTACYLVAGISGGEKSVTILANRLENQPQLISSLGLNPKGTYPNWKKKEYVDEAKLLEALKPTVVRTSRWTCNACGLLDQTSESASLIVQVAWASESVELDRNQVDSILVWTRKPLVEALAATVSAEEGSAMYVGNLTVVRYPYCVMERAPVLDINRMLHTPYEPLHPFSRKSNKKPIVPIPCLALDSVLNQTDCAIDEIPVEKFPWHLYEIGRLKPYANLVEYLTINKLLACQFVAVSSDEYSFNVQTWTVRLNHCDTDISAGDVTISDTDGAMLVCLEDYACWTNSGHTLVYGNIHDSILSWLSLVFTLVSMLCCFGTFFVYFCISKLRSAAGINNMVLAFTVFFAQGLAQFGSSQRDRADVCVTLGVFTHFFWLAAVAAMSTATFHMFYALSFPLRFQQYNGREAVLLRGYLGVVLFTPSAFIAITVVYSHAVTGNPGYGSGSSCFVDAGFPKILFFGAPVLAFIVANIGMYTYTVARLHGAPNIGDTKLQRNNVVLYSKLSVATGASWIFGFLYDWTELIAFAYAYMLTAPLLGLFLFLAFVANRRVFGMATEKLPQCCANLLPAQTQESASHTASSTIKITKSTSATDP